jgi:ABC-type multidrug transport system fused ATPase/permease subunit
MRVHPKAADALLMYNHPNVTEDGIAEQGTHAELVSSGGAYARLYNTQASI